MAKVNGLQVRMFFEASLLSNFVLIPSRLAVTTTVLSTAAASYMNFASFTICKTDKL